jgi:protein-S-isoprenylcysteine O-methyltransferase Ste14
VAPLVVLLLFSRPIIDENSFTGIVLTLIGWLIFGLYVTLRIWATLFIGSRKDRKLQSEGPYSLTRNPLYLGTFCFALSSVLLLKSIALAFVVGLGIVFYSRFVVKAEERFLAGQFGESFASYHDRTPRFLPSLSRFHSPDSVHVSLVALKSEAKRLWTAFLFPVTVGIIMHLRMSPHWPHWFRLP